MAQTGVRKRRRRRRLRWQFVAVMVLLCVGIIAALCLTVLFPVRQIDVQGETRYTADAVTDVSAIELESNLLLLNKERATRRILEQLPYIGECTLEKKLDGRVILSVQELPAVYAYQSGGSYYLVNEKEKVVELVDAEPQDACVVLGVDGDAPQVGQRYVASDAENQAVLTALQESIRTQQLAVTRIDLTTHGQIRFVVENRIMVEFGGTADLVYKMAHLASTLESMSASDEGTLDLTWWTTEKKDAYFRRGNILQLIYGADYTAPDAQPDATASDTSDPSAPADDAADTADPSAPADDAADTSDAPASSDAAQTSDTAGQSDGNFDEE